MLLEAAYLRLATDTAGEQEATCQLQVSNMIGTETILHIPNRSRIEGWYRKQIFKKKYTKNNVLTLAIPEFPNSGKPPPM